MQKEQVKELLEKQDGERSYMYPLLKSRLDGFRVEEIAFAEEFMFFEDRYLRMKLHMIEHGVRQDIVDIGCQLGFQSEIFLDSLSYVGVECHKPTRFFNEDENNVTYQVGVFPDLDVDIQGKTVISCMSLGYFDNFLGERREEASHIFAEALGQADNIYIVSGREFVERVAEHFDYVEVLDTTYYGDFNMYWLSRKEK